MHSATGTPAMRGQAAGGEGSPPVRWKDELHVVRAALVLAADAGRPLRDVPLRPDLLQSFAAAVLDVRPELEERVEVCVDLVPLTAAKEQPAARAAQAPGRRAQEPGGPSR